MPRPPFTPWDKQRENALEVMHSYLPEANVQSLGRWKYALTFKDEAAFNGTVVILANKQ